MSSQKTNINNNNRLTQKQENFTLNLFKGMYQRDAYIDAYHPTYSMVTIDGNASRLANNEKVRTRLAELRLKAEDDTIATPKERKQRLTEILRATLPDYMTENGIHVGKNSPNVGAIESLETVTRQRRDSHAGGITVKRPVVPEALRNAVFDRDDHKCVTCGAEENLQIDHIVALSRGGFTVESNLQTLCETCNKQKAGGKKSQTETITKIKLHNPIQAIDLLNKMDRIYTEGPPTWNDNRQYNIIVQGEDAKKNIEWLLSGGKPQPVE